MSLGIVRGLITLVLFAAFIALWAWAWSRQRCDEFDAAARLPLTDDAEDARASERSC